MSDTTDNQAISPSRELVDFIKNRPFLAQEIGFFAAELKYLNFDTPYNDRTALVVIDALRRVDIQTIAALSADRFQENTYKLTKESWGDRLFLGYNRKGEQVYIEPLGVKRHISMVLERHNCTFQMMLPGVNPDLLLRDTNDRTRTLRMIDQAAFQAKVELEFEAKAKAELTERRQAEDRALVAGAQDRVSAAIEATLDGLRIADALRHALNEAITRIERGADGVLAKVETAGAAVISARTEPRTPPDGANVIRIPDHFKLQATPLVRALTEHPHATTIVGDGLKKNDIELSVRSANCLKNEPDIRFLLELLEKSEQELLRVPNLGRRSLNEIKAMLTNCGFVLAVRYDAGSPQDLKLPPLGDQEDRRQALETARAIRDELGIQPGQACWIDDGMKPEHHSQKVVSAAGRAATARLSHRNQQAVTNPHPMALQAAARRDRSNETRIFAARVQALQS